MKALTCSQEFWLGNVVVEASVEVLTLVSPEEGEEGSEETESEGILYLEQSDEVQLPGEPVTGNLGSVGGEGSGGEAQQD